MNVEAYNLYLEGLANEIAHILQKIRRELNFQIMDYVDVCLVQSKSNKLTSCLYMFIDKIVERVRIVHFYPTKTFESIPKACEFTCCLGHKYEFDVYIRQNSCSQ